eukprot:1190287-Prorocentrum_minimum.AAC.7
MRRFAAATSLPRELFDGVVPNAEASAVADARWSACLNPTPLRVIISFTGFGSPRGLEPVPPGRTRWAHGAKTRCVSVAILAEENALDELSGRTVLAVYTHSVHGVHRASGRLRVSTKRELCVSVFASDDLVKSQRNNRVHWNESRANLSIHNASQEAVGCTCGYESLHRIVCVLCTVPVASKGAKTKRPLSELNEADADYNESGDSDYLPEKTVTFRDIYLDSVINYLPTAGNVSEDEVSVVPETVEDSEDEHFEPQKKPKPRKRQPAKNASEPNAKAGANKKQKTETESEVKVEEGPRVDPADMAVRKVVHLLLLRSYALRITAEREPPPEMLMPLLPFQKQWLAWSVAQEEGDLKGGILADEMGMGESLHWSSASLMIVAPFEATLARAAIKLHSGNITPIQEALVS